MQLQMGGNESEDDHLTALTGEPRRAELSLIFIVFLALFRIIIIWCWWLVGGCVYKMECQSYELALVA